MKPALFFAIMCAVLYTPNAYAEHLHVTDVWASPSIPGSKIGVAYFRVDNPTDASATLISASSPAAEIVELHTHIMHDDIMQMHKLDDVEVPAGESVVAQPHGLHLMLINLTQNLAVGEAVPITFTFANGESLTASALVENRKTKPMMMDDTGTDNTH